MKVLFSVIGLCLFALTSLAQSEIQQPLVRSAAADKNNYQATVHLNSNFISYSNYKINQLETNHYNKKLSLLYVEAQKLYFQKDYFNALKKYQEVIGHRNYQHWNSFSKKLLIQSFLKASELSHDLIDKNSYLSLIQNTFPNFPLETINMPMKVRKQIEKMKSQSSFWKIPESFEKFNFVVFNGEVHSLFPGKKIKIPGGQFLVTLFSDAFYPVRTRLDGLSIKHWLPSPRWVSSGTCEFPGGDKSETTDALYVFYTEKCIINTKNKKNYFEKKNTISNLADLKPVFTENQAKASRLNPMGLQTNAQPSQKSSWLKNKWIWLGVAAVAGAYAIRQSSDSGKKTTTTKSNF